MSAERGSVPTDWDIYYQSVPFTARFTRKYTESVLIGIIRRFMRNHEPPSVIELGGANSCFIDGILSAIHPRAYHVIDSNQYGLTLLRDRMGSRPNVFVHQGDVLQFPDAGLRAEIVFSIGLIEHFDASQTRKAINAHFDMLHGGGYAIISFPTPTWLYVLARSIAERLGKWRFTDERPLAPDEVRDAVKGLGEVVFEKTLWPLVFTQHLIVVRKTRPGPGLTRTSADIRENSSDISHRTYDG